MDRKLTPEEMQQFLSEVKTGRLEFRGLKAILEEKTEPSLHDICIHELHGAIEVLKQLAIQHGAEIALLKLQSEEKEKTE
jgi:rRNA-processing protein FCF1